MVKYDHDWNSQIEAWESDGRVFREPPERKSCLMEVFALEFLHFDGPKRTEFRGTVELTNDDSVHTLYSNNLFRSVRLGRFDALTGGNFSPEERPIDADYDVFIHTDLEDITHGELFLNEPSWYEELKLQRDNFKRRRVNHNKVLMWNTGQLGFPGERIYGSLCRFPLVGPHYSLNVLYAAYKDAVAATVQLTFMPSQQDFNLHVCGKVTARNTVLTDPDAYSTLFVRKINDYASLVPGDVIPLSKPSVVVPTTSSLLLDLDFEYRIPGSYRSSCDFLKSKSSIQVPALQTFQCFVDMLYSDAEGATGMLKVEVKWLKFTP